MKKIIMIILGLMLCVPYVSANLIITEIMYAPTETASDTDGEWIEIFNNGESNIDLTEWTIDGYNFDDIILESYEYAVIARELIDGDDTDLESFETAYGNGDGIWDATDGDYIAIDGYFSLGTEDTIILTNGNETETVYYNISYGANRNGKSLTRLNYSLPNIKNNWQEQEPNPGYGQRTNQGENQITLTLNVNNLEPTILNISLSPDNSLSQGIQIMPNINSIKQVEIEVNVEDLNGIDDIVEVQAIVNNQVIELNYNGITFNGSFIMDYSDPAGTYNVSVSVSDGDSITYSSIAFEYLEIIATNLNTDNLNFATLNPGEISSEQILTISNTGNTNIDVSIQGTDLVGSYNSIAVENVEYYFSNSWNGLSEIATNLDLDIQPMSENEILLRVNVPTETKSDYYQGALQITSIAS